MPANFRYKQLTERGVEKVKAKAAADKFKVSAYVNGEDNAKNLLMLAGISPNTWKNLIRPSPVYTNTLDRVVNCLNLALTKEDWKGIAAPPDDELRPEKSSIATITGYPVSECIGKMKTAKNVDFLNTWLVNKESLASHLVEGAFKREGKTRILILDPLSVHVAERAIDMDSGRMQGLTNLAETAGEKEKLQAAVRAGIMDTLAEISRLASRHPPSECLEVRVYDSTPTITLFRVDNYCCQGIYWRDHAEASTPHLVFTRQQNETWFETVESHFEAVWKRNTTHRYDVHSGKIVRGP